MDVNPSGSVVMIRCDIVKGKQSQNLVQPGWESQPRNNEGYVLDLGNIGKQATDIQIIEKIEYENF